MKQLSVLLLLAFFISCNKNDCPEPDNSFTGKWTEFENYISPGTIWQWEKASNIVVDIKSDLTYTSNNNNYFWGRSGSIENLTDSTFVLKSQVFSSPWPCNYKIKNGVLEIWYAGCIEGCGSRFKRSNCN